MDKSKSIDSPKQIGGLGWKKILMRVKERITEDKIPIVSAGVAFYAFLAIFPSVMALFSIYGLATDAQTAEEQITRLAEIMPEETISIIEGRMDNLMATSTAALGWGTVFSLLVAFWSANQGTKSLFTGLNVAYRTDNERGFIKQNALTLLFTFGAFIIIIVSLGFIVIFPILVNTIGLPGTAESLIQWLRWPILAIIVVFALSLVYQYAPARETPAFRWVVLGAAVATFGWLIASWGFAIYVNNFAAYGEMYGSLSAVVILLFWLFITSFIILVGGELNRASEAYAAGSLEEAD